ncbi:MAG: hypothetical protein H6666_15405 [Ardenticatenaceae bacterium]|nr:hypothetical protein [Anaerolineales bacterium]MCB8919302.1 hypothetical protein [Ardenticatenaceae bacterium]
MSDQLESPIIAETDNFIIWASREEGEAVFHVELGGISLHLSSEEWEELVILFKSIE